MCPPEFPCSKRSNKYSLFSTINSCNCQVALSKMKWSIQFSLSAYGKHSLYLSTSLPFSPILTITIWYFWQGVLFPHKQLILTNGALFLYQHSSIFSYEYVSLQPKHLITSETEQSVTCHTQVRENTFFHISCGCRCILLKILLITLLLTVFKVFYTL